MPYTIRVRRDTASNWSTINPILALGEMGYDVTNDKLKVGDGTSAWNSLTYLDTDLAPHTHGNITNGGLIGTTANLPIITGTGGILQAGSFGTAANTFCQGNDSRLSDARTPTAHTHPISDVTNLQTTLDGKASSTHTHAISDVTNLQTTLDGKAASSHTHDAGNITTGTIATNRLGSGTANNTSFLRGDQTWQTITSGVTDHGALTGLNDDDHPQYAKKLLSTNNQTASYTLATTDGGLLLEINSTSACDLNIPTNTSISLSVGTEITVLQVGSGQVSIVPLSGVTLNSKDNNRKLAGQWSACTLIKRATDTWVAIGDLVA